MAEKIEVTCAVCGLHTITVPAREGEYIIACPNKKSIISRRFTRIKVFDDGSITAQTTYANGSQ
jgi:hypothetical protein